MYLALIMLLPIIYFFTGCFGRSTKEPLWHKASTERFRSPQAADHIARGLLIADVYRLILVQLSQCDREINMLKRFQLPALTPLQDLRVSDACVGLCLVI